MTPATTSPLTGSTNLSKALGLFSVFVVFVLVACVCSFCGCYARCCLMLIVVLCVCRMADPEDFKPDDWDESQVCYCIVLVLRSLYF